MIFRKIFKITLFPICVKSKVTFTVHLSKEIIWNDNFD